jgi:hypothetical protein
VSGTNVQLRTVPGRTILMWVTRPIGLATTGRADPRRICGLYACEPPRPESSARRHVSVPAKPDLL